MDTQEEDKFKEEAFQVRDRRSRLSEEPASTLDPQSPPTQPDPVRNVTPDTTTEAAPRDEGPVTFASFTLSMATSVLGLLQEGSGPSRTQARQIIDALGLLQEKTKGNLTQDEETLLSQALFSLRMQFVELQKKRPL